MSKKLGIIVTAIFMVILAYPLFYNAFSSASPALPDLVKPKEGECVADADWMRHNHMNLLKHTRDDVVREGIREPKKGIQGCRSCHENRGEFCDKCHHYVGVHLECWGCHFYPESPTVIDHHSEGSAKTSLPVHGH